MNIFHSFYRLCLLHVELMSTLGPVFRNIENSNTHDEIVCAISMTDLRTKKSISNTSACSNARIQYLWYMQVLHVYILAACRHRSLAFVI